MEDEPALEFRAGRLNWDGKRVTAETDEGKITLTRESGAMRFKWHDRVRGTVKHDLVIVNDAYMERVPEAKSGRVYVLRFISSDRKLLFWMQESDPSVDSTIIEKFNQLNGSCHIQEKPDPPAKRTANDIEEPIVELSSIFTASALDKLLSREEDIQTLQKHLPASPEFQNATKEQIIKVFQSPQCFSAMRNITEAIYSDQFPLIMTSLGVTDQSESSSELADNNNSNNGSRGLRQNMRKLVCALEGVQERDYKKSKTSE